MNNTNYQEEYKREINKFAKEHLNDRQNMDEFNQKMWDQIADFGLFGLTIDSRYGGLGESFSTAAIVFEELGYACQNNGFIFSICNHIWVALNIINEYGNADQKSKYLPKMISGELKGALALTEPDAGSDSLGMSTTILETEDFFILNGSKAFVSNGPIADVFIVYGVSSTESGIKTSALIVDRSLEGVNVGVNIKKMGLDACPTSDVFFDQVKVPKGNLLGRIHNGNLLMTNTLEWERCYEFASHVGSMRYILERSYRYSKERKQFGKCISEFQAISHKISEMKIALEMSKLMLYKIGTMKDQGKTTYINTSIFKVYVSENYIKTCRDALQIFGAYGYTEEYGIERELRDALASTIYSGTNEMQKNTIFNFLISEI